MVAAAPPAFALNVVPKLIPALLLSFPSYPMNIPSASFPNAVEPPIPIYGLVPLFETNAITGFPAFVPIFTV